jgi:hypothetical protein
MRKLKLELTDGEAILLQRILSDVLDVKTAWADTKKFPSGSTLLGMNVAEEMDYRAIQKKLQTAKLEKGPEAA